VSGAPKAKLAPILVLITLAAFFYWWGDDSQQLTQPNQLPSQPISSINTESKSKQVQTVDDSDYLLAQAFADKRSDVMVEGSGQVIKLLKDDNEGSRHQKLLIRLKSGQTILIAHNIDLAPRVDRVQQGDDIDFKGEYEYNPQGGVIHWTHHDPQGQHEDGWLKYQGKTYQ
jgi:hypothetical protein